MCMEVLPVMFGQPETFEDFLCTNFTARSTDTSTRISPEMRLVVSRTYSGTFREKWPVLIGRLQQLRPYGFAARRVLSRRHVIRSLQSVVVNQEDFSTSTTVHASNIGVILTLAVTG